MTVDGGGGEGFGEELSGYLDGVLPEPRRRAVEEHLAECSRCAEALEDLRALRAAARALGPIDPPRDLWPEVRAKLEAARRPLRDVRPASGRRDPRGPRARPMRRRVHLTVPQLVAAAAALMVVPSAAAWWAGARSRSEEPDAVSAERALDLKALQEGVRARGGALAPEVARVLERNLTIIDRAIEDSRRALASDPDNAFLARHLERAYRLRASYLDEALRIASWSG